MSVHTATETKFGTLPNAPVAEKSIGELFADLSRESTDLVRQEINLAKAEMTQKASKLGKDVGMIVGGVTVAGTGLLVLTAAIVLALANVVAPWIAAGIVAIVYLAIGGIVAWQGFSALKHVNPVPHATVETLKEDAQWLKSKA